MAFFQKIAQYLADEIITKRLAQSHTFQRLALRTHENLNKTSTAAKEHSKVLSKTFTETGKQAGESIKKNKSFLAEVKDEILRELRIKK